MFGLLLPGSLIYILLALAVVSLEPEAAFAPVCGGLVLVGYNLSMASRTMRDIGRGGAVPGIYEHGLEMPVFPISGRRAFVPWEEVEDAWLRRYPINEMVLVSVRGSRWRWRFPLRMMEPRGLSFIQGKIAEMRVARALELEGKTGSVAPRLVVYTAGGPSLSTAHR
jgi:hypothetical protein